MTLTNTLLAGVAAASSAALTYSTFLPQAERTIHASLDDDLIPTSQVALAAALFGIAGTHILYEISNRSSNLRERITTCAVSSGALTGLLCLTLSIQNFYTRTCQTPEEC